MFVFSQTIPLKDLIHGWKNPFPVMIFQFNIVWRIYAILFLYYNPQYSPIYCILSDRCIRFVGKYYFTWEIYSHFISNYLGKVHIFYLLKSTQSLQNLANGIFSKSYFFYAFWRDILSSCVIMLIMHSMLFSFSCAWDKWPFAH